MKQLLIVISLLFSCISMSWGQNGFMVAGTVMDENGEPLIGVSVVNQANTSQGTEVCCNRQQRANQNCNESRC